VDFSDEISALAQRIAQRKDTVETEEATKNAFVMPFLKALGYDVFDPLVVVPEFTADVGVKKGEKVDYAVKIDGSIALLVECKPCRSALCVQHMSQLYRYFSVTEARFAILTNGITYWFFSDLDQSNKMDSKPFFEFDMLNYRPAQVDELKKFSTKTFNMSAILETANDLKYGSLLMREIAKEFDEQSDEFSRLLIGRVYEGKITANVFAKFTPLVQKAMRDTVRELVNQRLTSAMDDTAKTALPPATAETAATDECCAGVSPEDTADLRNIVTTDDEKEAYQIVRAIVREVLKVERVSMRDAKSYCAILIDDNNRKPICRLHFNRGIKYIGVFDAEKAETRFRINRLDDIFSYAEQLKAMAAAYGEASVREPVTA